MDVEKMLAGANDTDTGEEVDHCLKLNQTTMPWLTW